MLTVLFCLSITQACTTHLRLEHTLHSKKEKPGKLFARLSTRLDLSKQVLRRSKCSFLNLNQSFSSDISVVVYS